jgi:UPF0755 protein
MKNKKQEQLILNILGFLTGSAFNILLFLLTIFLIYIFTVQAYDYGKETADEIVAEKPSQAVEVNIPEDATTWEIAQILKEENLIGNEFLFLIESRLNGTYDLLKSGEYTLNTDMSAGAIMEALQIVQKTTVADSLTVTIPEGLTVEQVADLLASKELFTAEEFITACDTGTFDYAFLANIPERDHRLEGYLFPDTYFVSLNPTPEEVITKMLDRFDEIYSQELRVQTDAMGLTMDDVVIMSSIIEKEISAPSERVLASAVIHNRLASDTKLEMCSTIIYALDKRKDRLLLTDLEIESPYNTYLYPGLPAGPIASPGAASIEAALNPADVDYLYFVLKDEEAGEHVFTASYDAFLNAKEQYNQIF